MSHSPRHAETKKKPSSVIGLYASSGTGLEWPEQIKGILREDPDEEDVGVLIPATGTQSKELGGTRGAVTHNLVGFLLFVCAHLKKLKWVKSSILSHLLHSALLENWSKLNMP
jgi:hypothetical protein